MNESTDKLLINLIAKQLENGLNAAEEKELNFMLLSSKEARDIYLKQCQLHGMLLEERELLENINDELPADNVIPMFETTDEKSNSVKRKTTYIKWVSMITGAAASIIFLFVVLQKPKPILAMTFLGVSTRLVNILYPTQIALQIRVVKFF